MTVSALLMGLVGGPHCVAMCGAACAGIAKVAEPHGTRALWQFQLSRWLGYTLLGALAGGTVQGLGWLGQHTVVLRPVWTMMHVAALVLGVALLVRGRQPALLEHWAQWVWRRTRPWLLSLGRRAPWVLGAGWALMPCGLLYSALLVASLTASAWEGAWVMSSFAVGTSVSLFAAPWLMLRLQQARSGAWGIRLAGAALAGVSAWALWMGVTQPTGLWCA